MAGHWRQPAHGRQRKSVFTAAHGITGGGLPIATGVALAQKLKNENAVTLAFFGDGASAQGTFHESMNLAAVWTLPLVFLCENNGYAMGTHVGNTCPEGNIARRADGYGIKSFSVDGTDPREVMRTVAEARKIAVSGGGPVFIEAKTIRLEGHSRSDKRDYINIDILESEKKNDPLPAFKEILHIEGVSQADIESVENETEAEVETSAENASAQEKLTTSEFAKMAGLDDSASVTHKIPASIKLPDLADWHICWTPFTWGWMMRQKSDDKTVLLRENIA